jgi:DedD protein
MVNRSEAPDLAVDELKRRARRRLVGAIVLALAAAVLLPLLLESEPKPLGDEVSIQIPPIDNSKFVNPLSPGKATDAKSAKNGSAAKSAPITEPSPSVAPASPASASPAPETVAEAKTEGDAKSSAAAAPPIAAAASAPAPAAAPPAAPQAAAVQKEAPAEVKAAPEAKAAARPAPSTEAVQSSAAFALQVAAFTDRYGAQTLARRLKQAGFPAYVEPVASEKGELQRVRVGPYATRDAANAARTKLKTAGYSAIVTQVR